MFSIIYGWRSSQLSHQSRVFVSKPAIFAGSVESAGRSL
jgi:hypothetical protein